MLFQKKTFRRTLILQGTHSDKDEYYGKEPSRPASMKTPKKVHNTVKKTRTYKNKNSSRNNPTAIFVFIDILSYKLVTAI